MLISIHALLAESDWPGLLARPFLLISIHALLAESDHMVLQVDGLTPISIHALLAESDGGQPKAGARRDYFYPRSPCGERHRCVLHSLSQPLAFLSTLSLRRATPGIFLYLTFHENFYPRSPCGERRNAHPDIRQPCAISIHALLAESDVKIMSVLNGLRHFYPRSPCGERPPVETINVGSHDFYPRSPCGERLMHTLIFANPVLFLSTLSLRRATLHNAVHSLARNFYPRSPCGERQFSLGPVSSGDKFLSTLSLRRATAGCSRALIVAVISIHALLAESDISTNNHVRVRQNFYPRSPCGERLYRP